MTRRAYATPRVGDEAVAANGWKRVVRAVDSDRVDYERDGVIRRCSLATWVRWCRRFVDQYHRNGAML